MRIIVTTTPRELMESGHWAAACEMLGLHPDVASEYRANLDAAVVLSEAQAREMGLLNGGMRVSG